MMNTKKDLYYDSTYFENIVKKHRADIALFKEYRATKCPTEIGKCPTCTQAWKHKEQMDLDVEEMDTIVQELVQVETEFRSAVTLCDHVMHDIDDLYTHAYGAEDNRHAGVYFLMREENVVYVGQSINVLSRIQKHKNDKTKDFNLYNYILCDVESLDIMESLYIHRFKPEYNKNVPISFHMIISALNRPTYKSGPKEGKPKKKVLCSAHTRNMKPNDPPMADGLVTGLWLIPNKTKGQGKWILRFVSEVTGTSRDMGLGVFPNVSIAQVRVVARAARALLEEGKDPIEERNKTTKQNTFKHEKLYV